MTPHLRDEASVRPPAIDPAAIEGLREGLRIRALRRLQDADAAEEAVQEILARTLRLVHEGRVPRPEELAPIAHGIARHVLADEVRRRIRASRLSGLAAWLPRARSAPDALAALIAAEERRGLQAAWERLSREDRELLRLSFYEELPSVELARRTGEPAERLRKRKSRALERLRRAFLGASAEDAGAGPAGDGHARLTRAIEEVNREDTLENIE